MFLEVIQCFRSIYNSHLLSDDTADVTHFLAYSLAAPSTFYIQSGGSEAFSTAFMLFEIFPHLSSHSIEKADNVSIIRIKSRCLLWVLHAISVLHVHINERNTPLFVGIFDYHLWRRIRFNFSTVTKLAEA